MVQFETMEGMSYLPEEFEWEYLGADGLKGRGRVAAEAFETWINKRNYILEVKKARGLQAPQCFLSTCGTPMVGAADERGLFTYCEEHQEEVRGLMEALRPYIEKTPLRGGGEESSVFN